ELAESRLQLARELGLRNSDTLTCVGSLSPQLVLPEFDTLAESLLCSHPDLRDLDLNRADTRAERTLLQAEKRPTWSVGAGIRQFREDRAHGFLVSIETELPDRRLHRGRLQALERADQKTAAQRHTLIEQLTQLLREQCVRFANARTQALEISEHILPRSRELRDMALEAYQSGKTDLLELLVARKDALEASRQHLSALSDLYQAADAIEQLCGMCLVGESHHSPTHKH
ncbi:MAG TPA: TolC family protein, partial [Candidatus Ozemobacteraceae bacterium]|nr:TolC family protein [Candidatus Ozemobacteraceae bacterium]